MSSPLKVTLSRGPPDHVPGPEHSFSRGATPISCLLESLQVLSPREGISFLFFQLKSQPCFRSLGWEFVFSKMGLISPSSPSSAFRAGLAARCGAVSRQCPAANSLKVSLSCQDLSRPRSWPLSGHPHLVAR